MATVQQQTTQLEFHQAMADFKTMFPAMDDDVIEAVLRSNQGAVDATIDQLLAMSTDNENEKIRQQIQQQPQPMTPQQPPIHATVTQPMSQETALRVADKKTNSGTNEALCKSRGWETAAVLAPLPDDFLRLPPEFIQSDGELEDERIAMLLQNDEFMAELRWNKDFLSALDKDSPPEERLASFSSRLGDDDAIFKERLRNMGKLSRKKFSQLARVFTGRKKRSQSAKSILSHGPKDSHLLREDCDSDTY
ncbi:hypothetical protein AAG570_000769 [Ranatra chinensis]|uniref:CUE domain-containing protein n=1 Tax=Ranatra chinensis TaxID=642074 RepID=A0ABD0YYP2_9HEMI